MREINSIKNHFEKWLDRHVGINAGTFKTNHDLSIFEYANEFKDYVSSVFDDTADISMDLSSLFSLEIADGQFVIPEEEVTEAENNTPKELFGTEKDTTNETQETQEVASLLNNLFNDATFKKAIDTNKDGELSKEEINDFLTTISNADDNAKNISLKDIMAAMQTVAEGEKLSTLKRNTTKTKVNLDNNNTTQTVTPTQTNNTYSNNTYSNNNTNSNNTYNNSDNSPKEKSLENMDKSELNEELTAADKTLNNKQDQLSDAIDGNTKALQGFKDNIETAYEKYQTELEKVNKDMAKDVDELKTAIDKKQSDIDENDKAIATQETEVSSAQNTYNNAVTTRKSLEESLKELESTDTSNMSKEQINELNSNIDKLKNTEIPQAQQSEEDAKIELDNAQKALDELNKKKDELINGEDGLTKLQDQMNTLQEQILKAYPEIQQYMQDYIDAQNLFTEEQTKEVESTQIEVNEAQTYKDEVETAIATLEIEEKEQEYTVKTYDAAEGDRLVSTARAMLNKYGSSTGYCATGVSRTISMAYGISMSGNGCDWDTNMDKLVSQGMFREATTEYPTSEYLSSLPAGAVVCWEATTGTGGGGAQYGHVTIADGNGGEISDHYASNIYTTIGGRRDNFRVFLPV